MSDYRHGMRWVLPGGDYYVVKTYGSGDSKGSYHYADGRECGHSGFDVYRAGGSWKRNEMFKTEKGCAAAIERKYPRGHWEW